VKTPPSCKKKMATTTKKVDTLALDDVGVHWNNAFCDFEVDQVDGTESLGYDELDPRNDIAIAPKEVQVVVAIITSKLGVSKHDVASTFVYSVLPNVASCIRTNVVQSQGPHELIAMLSHVLNVGLQGGWVLSLINNVLLGNLVNLCVRLQGRLGRFLTFNMMGQWNPLQQLQVMQAFQTLASLGLGQMGQHLGLFNDALPTP
jgi:hypothetical protein